MLKPRGFRPWVSGSLGEQSRWDPSPSASGPARLPSLLLRPELGSLLTWLWAPVRLMGAKQGRTAGSHSL